MIDAIGVDWLRQQVVHMQHQISRIGPVAYNEENRYLPQGVSPRPGFIRYDLFPYLRELLEAFDPYSPVREVNLKKGVQTGYTTLLESILFYYIGHVTTQPVLYITADKELAKGRIDNNIMPMLVESEMMHRIRAADVTNTRKTGQTDGNIQWDGGGYLIYNGAQNAAKMRQFSMPVLLKDEVDAWPRIVGKDGDPDTLTDDRASAYWAVRKILRGSTPTEAPSLIGAAYRRGDQRIYLVLCRGCGFPQELRMQHRGTPGGFQWDFNTDGSLALDSVRYRCKNCSRDHFETDKEKLFATEEGAHWQPTATPIEPGVRSYHLPAFYSPYGFRPWSKNISLYLEAWDGATQRVTNHGKYQVFYNNVLGEEFVVLGGRVTLEQVSPHRRTAYKFGEIPNRYAKQFSGSRILFLTCQIDVHKSNLAVTVMGWTAGGCCYVINYWRFEGEDCTQTDDPVWSRVAELLEEKRYTADDGAEYNIVITFVDAGYATDTVVQFCARYVSSVYPILGRERPGKHQTIKEFGEFVTSLGTVGYKITVDHYKDRMASVLRREWVEDAGPQKPYTVNAPMDITTKQLKEWTIEVRKEKVDDRGNTSYVWHRPGNANQELWDLLGYGFCAVDVLAYLVCIQHFEGDTVDWPTFWAYIEQEHLYFTPPPGEV